MNIYVTTTCSAKDWDQFGRRCVETFIRYWPKDCILTVYTEGFKLPKADNVVEAHFPRWFLDWKERHLHNSDAHGLDVKRNRRGRSYDYRRDCVKFSHKVAAICDSVPFMSNDDDLFIWMDADILTHEVIDEAWLRDLFPSGWMAWLDRTRYYPECGFMMWRSQNCLRFFELLQNVYIGGQVFRLLETHDSYVIEQIVKTCGFPMPHSLSGPVARTAHHPFVLSRLGERLDHAKGRRKLTGTPRCEVGGRSEKYWRGQ